MSEQMITLSERDSLALEWELHQVRWLAQELVGEITSVLRRFAWELPPVKERLEYGEMSRGQLIEERDSARQRLPAILEDAVSAHAAERAWWQEHKQTVPINELRVAVRKKMADVGAPIPAGTLDADAAERTEDRMLRWVLSVRAEIARRRIVCGRALMIAQEALADLPAKAQAGLDQLQQIHGHNAEWEAMQRARDMNDTQLAEFVARSEKAAAAYGTTGPYTTPGWLTGDMLS